jgi:hypothetical protein
MSDLVKRLRAYGERRRKARGLCQEVIHGFDVTPDGGIELTTKDVADAADRIEALEAALWKAMDAQLRLVSVYSSSHDSDTRFSAWEQSKASVAAINDLLKD